MTLHTVEAFKWTGTYYSAQYNTSYTATIDDDDGAYEGSDDSDEMISIDGGPFGSTVGGSHAIDISFTDTGGNAHTETFFFFHTNSAWYFIPGPDSEFTVGATLGGPISGVTGWDYATAVCFCKGTMIETDCGPVAVEELELGARIKTADGAFKELRLLLRRQVSAQELLAMPKLRPVRIIASALGNDLPKRDLLISRQHRMLASSPIAQRMFGHEKVLVSAINLTVLPGIFLDQDIESVEYFHLVFDQHEVIYAEGALSESLYTGPEALKSLTPESLDELLALFPDIFEMDIPSPAYQIPKGGLQKQFVARLIKNNKTILGG